MQDETAKRREVAGATLVLTRRAWLPMIALPIAILGTSAAAVSFLMGSHPQSAGAGLFGGLAVVFLAALAHYGRIERAEFDPLDGVTLTRRSLLGRKSVRYAMDRVSHAALDRIRARSRWESAGWTSPRWVDAERPVLVLGDGTRVPIFHLHLGGTSAEKTRDRIEAWLAEARAPVQA